MVLNIYKVSLEVVSQGNLTQSYQRVLQHMIILPSKCICVFSPKIKTLRSCESRVVGFNIQEWMIHNLINHTYVSNSQLFSLHGIIFRKKENARLCISQLYTVEPKLCSMVLKGQCNVLTLIHVKMADCHSRLYTIQIKTVQPSLSHISIYCSPLWRERVNEWTKVLIATEWTCIHNKEIYILISCNKSWAARTPSNQLYWSPPPVPPVLGCLMCARSLGLTEKPSSRWSLSTWIRTWQPTWRKPLILEYHLRPSR